MPDETHPTPSALSSMLRKTLASDLILTAAFILFFLIQLAHHEMWRDELNAFGIAAASHTLAQLLHYVHYEGHPWLWYALLWLVSRVTVFPVGMKVLQAFIGTGIYLCIGVRSPFSRPQKLLLFLSYFVCFEYTVLSRMYGLMLLLALLYLRRRAAKPDGVLGNALLLGLLASSDVMGLILSVALILEYLCSPACRSLWARGAERRKVFAAAATYCGLLLLSTASLVPARDISTRTTGKMFAEATKRFRIAEAVVDYTVMPFFPTVTGHHGIYWGALLESHWFLLLVPVVCWLYWRTLRGHTHLLVLQGSTMLMVMIFADLFYRGYTRHFGITFVAFIACLWLLRSEGNRVPWSAYPLLVLTMAGGLVATIGSWRHPFSNAEATADWLRAEHLELLPLVGSPDTSVVGVAELLSQPIYMLDCDCEDTFVLFSARRDAFSPVQVPQHLALAEAKLNAPEMIYLATRPFTAARQAEIHAATGLSLDLLTKFTGAEAGHEDFYAYRLRTLQR